MVVLEIVYCWKQFPVLDGPTYQLDGKTKIVDATQLAANDLRSGLLTVRTIVDQLFLIFALAIPFGKTVSLLYFSKAGKDVSGVRVSVHSWIDLQPKANELV